MNLHLFYSTAGAAPQEEEEMSEKMPGPPPQRIGPPVFSVTSSREELAVALGLYRGTEFRNILWASCILVLSLRWPQVRVFRGFVVDE